MAQKIRILGIETSCDETAASVVSCNSALEGEILSNVVLSQIETHAAFGGVVPEIAARAHLEALDGVIKVALMDAETDLQEIDAIAVTAGPGLVGGVMVGVVTAKALALASDKPLLGINHLEGHALTPRLTEGLSYPYLLLLVSGGHSQILLIKGLGDYKRWATTIDDALGEAFDKTAKLLSLPYPGGPSVEKAAAKGNPKAHQFPRPLKGQDTLNMSFSGLKTAVRQVAQKHAPLNDAAVSDICASFQAAIVDVLVDRSNRAMQRFEQQLSMTSGTLVIAGGVAANQAIRSALENIAEMRGWQLSAPPMKLCTDNAAMIAWAGAERYLQGEDHGLEFEIHPRWPLDEKSPAQLGSGKRGAKV